MSPVAKNHLQTSIVAAGVAILALFGKTGMEMVMGRGDNSAVTRSELREELAPMRIDVSEIKRDVAELKTDKAIRDDRDKRGLASAGLLK